MTRSRASTSARWSRSLGVLLLLGACSPLARVEDAGDDADVETDDAAAETDADLPDEDAGKPADAGKPVDAGKPADAAPVEPACEVTPPTSCPTPPVYYEDVAPIIMERCYSCHDGRGPEWPLTTYSHVTGWSMELRAAMVTCSMPPADAGISMPAEEREKILTWLICKMPQRGDAGAGSH